MKQCGFGVSVINDRFDLKLKFCLVRYKGLDHCVSIPASHMGIASNKGHDLILYHKIEPGRQAMRELPLLSRSTSSQKNIYREYQYSRVFKGF